MGFLSYLFGKGDTAELQARELIKHVEKFLKKNGPMITSKYMGSDEFKRLEKEYWPPELIGPGGRLHSEFLALLEKIKTKGDKEYGVTHK